MEKGELRLRELLRSNRGRWDAVQRSLSHTVIAMREALNPKDTNFGIFQGRNGISMSKENISLLPFHKFIK